MTGSEDGVVGLRGSSLSCFSCEFQVQSCQHVVKLVASEEELVYEMPDFLVDFFAEKCYRASAYEKSGQSGAFLLKRFPLFLAFLRNKYFRRWRRF